MYPIMPNLFAWYIVNIGIAEEMRQKIGNIIEESIALKASRKDKKPGVEDPVDKVCLCNHQFFIRLENILFVTRLCRLLNFWIKVGTQRLSSKFY